MKRPPSSYLAYSLLIAATLFWAGNFVLARASHASIPPMMLSLVRWAIALLVLLPLGGKTVIKQHALWWPYRKRIVLLALLGIAGFNSLVYWGVQYTVATNAVLLNSFIPILIALLGALFFGLSLRWRQGLGVMLSFAGVLLIVAHGEPLRLLALQVNKGDILVFLAMIAWAVYTLLLRGIPAEVNRLGLLTLLVAIGLVGVFPFFCYEFLHGATVIWSTQTLLTFAYVGTLPSVAAYYFYNVAVAHVGAARAGSFIHLMPAFGALLSVLFLGEHIYWFHFLGIVAILCGVVVSTRAGR